MKSPARPILSFDTFSTPLGDFSIAVNEKRAIVAAVFGGEATLHKCLKVIGMEDGDTLLVRDPAPVKTLRSQVEAYFAGSRTPFVFEVAGIGSLFQEKVWKALREIPHGETRSYGEVAKSLGSPGAARAVGRANGANPVCLFVPCHRVIGADGSLTGYAYGEKIKRKLLELEKKP